jgi:DNA primase
LNGRRVSDQLVETIRDRSDLVSLVSEYLTLKKTGQNFTGLCPFHAEKTPSFSVNPSKQFFHCFGCGVGGDIFQFVMKIEGIPFPEALRRLAIKAGVALPEATEERESPARREAAQIYELNEAAAAYFHQNLLDRPEGAFCRDYLKTRGITAETIKTFLIGFALPRRDDLLKQLGKRFSRSLLEKAGLTSRREGAQGEEALFDRFRNRVLFPIRNLQGRVVGFGGRVLDDSQPKYLNTPETPVFTKGKHLFALDRAKGAGIHSLIIVEGYFDVVAAHQAGVPNVVGTMGTALTPDHLRLIRRISEKVLLIFDPDEAGARAALRTAPLLIEEGISAKVVSLPPGEDPDLFIRKEGKTGFLKTLEEGKTPTDFAIFKLAEASAPKSVDDKIKIIEEIFPLIERLKNKVEQSHYLKRLSDVLQIKEQDLRAEFSSRIKKNKGTVAPNRPSPPEESKLPHDEETIASLLLQSQIDPSALVNQLDLEDFTDPRIRGILSHFWNTAEGRWSSPSRLGELEEPLLALYSRLSVYENRFEDVQQTARDYIIALRAKRLRRESSEIESKIKLAERGGDLPLVKSLQQHFLKLRKELSHLTPLH